MSEPYLSMVIVGGVVIISGLVGGMASHVISIVDLSTKDKKGKKKRGNSLLFNLGLGIAASFTVPAFLSLVKSPIVVGAEKNASDLFTLFGFGVLAGVAPRAFFRAALLRLIGEKADDASDRASAAGVALAEASDLIASGGLLSNLETERVRGRESGGLEMDVLKAMVSSKGFFVAVGEVRDAVDAESESKVLQTLERLREQNLVGNQGDVWFATMRGRATANVKDNSE